MSSPAEILPNIEIIYTSAACDACDKYHVCLNLKMCGGQALNCDICTYTQQPEDLDLVFTIWKMGSRVAKGDSMSAQQYGRWKSCTDN